MRTFTRTWLPRLLVTAGLVGGLALAVGGVLTSPDRPASVATCLNGTNWDGTCKP